MTVTEFMTSCLLFFPLLGGAAMLVGYMTGLGWFLGHTRREQAEQARQGYLNRLRQ